MKMIALTIAVFTLLSVGVSASQRGYDLRDLEYWTVNGASGAADVSATASAALAIAPVIGSGSNFQKTMELSIENLQGRH